MTASSGSELPSPQPWWSRIARWLWKGLLWLWGAIFLGVGINVGSTWLTSQTFQLTNTPLGWLLEHLSTTIPLCVSLLALTTLTGLVTAFQKKSSSLSSLLTLEQQNRMRFLVKLHTRYADILEHSLQGAAQIVLVLHSKPDAVINTTRLRFRQAHLPEHPFPAGTSLLQVYDQAGGELLILGDPGTGKTTLLLNLAQALYERATQDEHAPLPVIVNLSTWANARKSLQEWLVEDITRSYAVPLSPVARWIQEDRLLPLLDGLDEVPEAARSACIEAINTFKQQHLALLVVCSRTQEYVAQQRRLILQNAVVIQPLGEDQVDNYFKAAGKSLAGIRSMLRKNAELRELARMPLMLHLMTLIYQGVSVQALPKKGTVEEQRRLIFEQYTQRRLEDQEAHGSRQHTLHSLSWLAREMRIHNQTVFYLEHLQPDSLPKGHARDWYERLAMRGVGIIIGVVLSLFVTTLVFGVGSRSDEIWYGCVGGLVGGVISGSEPSGFQMKGIRSFLLQHWRYLGLLGACIGMLVGGLVAVGSALPEDPSFPYEWLIYGSSLGLCGSLLTIIITSGKQIAQQRNLPLSYQHWWHRIRPHGLQPDHFHLGIVVGLLLGLSYGLSAGLSTGLTTAALLNSSLLDRVPLLQEGQ